MQLAVCRLLYLTLHAASEKAANEVAVVLRSLFLQVALPCLALRLVFFCFSSTAENAVESTSKYDLASIRSILSASRNIASYSHGKSPRSKCSTGTHTLSIAVGTIDGRMTLL